ncbi:hypothetical protein ACHAXA_003027 [Cyclostephanos tholiformis]|uniref:UBC core domain-containing protein n=1 Tax=Cyclostephanos tholiformis TaxID=382380 RepID=A0ABD3RB55_9STRA
MTAKPSKMTISRRRTLQAPYYLLLISVVLLLVDSSLAREGPFMLSTASSSRVVQLTTTTPLQRKARKSRSDEKTLEGINRPSSPEMTLVHRRRPASTLASCGGSTGCASGDGGIIRAGIRDDDNEILVTSRIITNFLLDSLLSIRGGASSSSHHENNAVQGVLKSILASTSLPSPIKRLIEIICGYIENLTDWKVLPRMKEDRKSKSKKTKSRVKSLFEEVSVGVGGATKKKRGDVEKMEDEEDIEMAVFARKRRKRKQQAESASIDVPWTREGLIAKEESMVSAGVATTDTTTNHSTTSPSTDAASRKFLSSSLKSSNPNYRIQRELKEFLTSPPPGLSVKISGKNVRLWIVTLSMPSNTIYAGETYKLRIQFPADYPTSPPSVYFLPPTPRHEHVYTNGDICLSLLGSDWRPIMTAQSVAQAIMSILCGAQRKSLPMDNARHAGNKPGKKQDDWVYHDDNC